MTRGILDYRLSRPIKIMLIGATLVLFAVVVYLPTHRTLAREEKRIAAAREAYAQAMIQTDRYRTFQRNREEQGPPLQEHLFSYLERLSRDQGLESKVSFIRPENFVDSDDTEVEAVNIAFAGITLAELISFLHQVEILRHEIYIRSLSIQKDDQQHLVVQMTLQKYE